MITAAMIVLALFAALMLASVRLANEARSLRERVYRGERLSGREVERLRVIEPAADRIQAAIDRLRDAMQGR